MNYDEFDKSAKGGHTSQNLGSIVGGSFGGPGHPVDQCNQACEGRPQSQIVSELRARLNVLTERRDTVQEQLDAVKMLLHVFEG